jgi:hypothetical protein
VETAAGLAAALRQTAQPAAPVQPRAILRPRWSIPLAVAAAIVAIAIWPRDPLRRLADPGTPPTFAPASVRSESDITGSADRGMAAYQRGDYAEAASLLAEAAGTDATPGLQFFLGISRLLSGDAPGAVDPLREVAHDDGSPYSAEAQLWLAKSWIRIGAVDSAFNVLERLADRPDSPALSAHAKALGDSLRQVRPR